MSNKPLKWAYVGFWPFHTRLETGFDDHFGKGTLHPEGRSYKYRYQKLRQDGAICAQDDCKVRSMVGRQTSHGRRQNQPGSVLR